MKGIRISVTLSSTSILALLVMQPSMVVHAKSSFAGTWEGKMNDLPGVELKIDENEGKISGTTIFYFQERNDPNGGRGM